tara:strand:+ start:770 stop:1774 length:1005 start_codon:yes stop_codon:yes gene_type:complete
MARKTKLSAGSKTPATQRKETIAIRKNAKVANPNASNAKIERQARSASIKAAALLAKAKREAAALNRKAAAAAKPGILQKKLISFHTSHTKSLAKLRTDAAAGTKPVWHHTVAAEEHVAKAQDAAGHPDPNKSHPSIQLMHASHAMEHLKQYADSRLGSPYGLGDQNLAISNNRTHRDPLNAQARYATAKARSVAQNVRGIAALHIGHKDEAIHKHATELSHRARGMIHDLQHHTPEAMETESQAQVAVQNDKREKRGLISRLLHHVIGEDVQRSYHEPSELVTRIRSVLDEKNLNPQNKGEARVPMTSRGKRGAFKGKARTIKWNSKAVKVDV